MSIIPHAVMEHRLSTRFQSVLFIMSPESWNLTNTFPCTFAGVHPWRATRNKLSSSLETLFCEWLFPVYTVLSAFTELITVLVEIIAICFRHEGTILQSVGNIQRVHWWMNKVPSNTSAVKLSKTPDQERSGRSPVPMDICTISSMFSTSWLDAGSCGELIDLMESFQASDPKSLLITSEQPLRLCTFPAVSKAFYVSPMDILTR